MAVLGEVAEIPLALKGHLSMLKFWNRIRHMDDKTLVKKAYQENLSINSNWCKTIQVLNCSQNLHNRPLTPTEFPKIAKQNINNTFVQYWQSRIRDRNSEKKLETYAQIKHKFQIDAYLNLPSFKDRQIISKFICSNHWLEIERGRYKNIPREDRICTVCNLKVTEDENHFLLICPAYSEIRKSIFTIGETILGSVEAIFNQTHPGKIAKFLKLAFEHREVTLEKQRERHSCSITSLSDTLLTIRKLTDTDKPYRPLIPQPLQTTNITSDGLKVKISRKSQPHNIQN